MATSKDLWSHVGHDLALASASGQVLYNTLNGTIQYTDSIVASAAYGWDLVLPAYIAAIADEDATITLVYSESIDNSTWQTAVVVKAFTYTASASTVKEVYAATVDPEDFLSTTTHVKFGFMVEMDTDVGETGTFNGSLTANGIGVRDIGLAAWDDYKPIEA